MNRQKCLRLHHLLVRNRCYYVFETVSSVSNYYSVEIYYLLCTFAIFYTYPNLPVTALLSIHLLIEQIRHYFVPGDVLGHQTAAVNPTDKVTLLSCGLYFGLGKQTINKQTDTM